MKLPEGLTLGAVSGSGNSRPVMTMRGGAMVERRTIADPKRPK